MSQYQKFVCCCDRKSFLGLHRPAFEYEREIRPEAVQSRYHRTTLAASNGAVRNRWCSDPCMRIAVITYIHPSPQRFEMWETPAVPASSNGLCKGWDSFSVPRFAEAGHFHGSLLLGNETADNEQLTLHELAFV